MEAGEQEKKDLPPQPSRLSKFKKKLWGPALVGASLLAGLGAKGGATNTYSAETGTPSAASEHLNEKVVVPELARDTEVSAEQEKIPIPFVNIMQGTDSKFIEGANIVISDPASWTEHWNMINTDPNRPIPEIDFSKNVLILAAQGPSTGRRNMIEVKKIEEGANVIDIEIESTIPNASCPLMPGESSPFQVISFPTTKEKPINFRPTQDIGCYDIDEATSSRYNPGTGQAIYNPATVTKTPYEPSQ